MARRSIISMAAGVMPAAMMRDTASPASPIVEKAASTVSVDSGTRTIRRTTSVTMPSVPSLPITTPSRS